MALFTTATVKSILGITSTTYDSRIATLIPLVEADLKLLCNRTFLASDGVTEDWPAGIQIPAARMIGEILVSEFGRAFASERIDDYSYTLRNPVGVNGYSKDVADALKRYTYLVTGIASIRSRFPELRGYFMGIVPEELERWR